MNHKTRGYALLPLLLILGLFLGGYFTSRTATTTKQAPHDVSLSDPDRPADPPVTGP